MVFLGFVVACGSAQTFRRAITIAPTTAPTTAPSFNYAEHDRIIAAVAMSTAAACVFQLFVLWRYPLTAKSFGKIIAKRAMIDFAFSISIVLQLEFGKSLPI